MTHQRLVELVLASSWPARRDPMVADANWFLWVEDLWRTVCGIPSVFA